MKVETAFAAGILGAFSRWTKQDQRAGRTPFEAAAWSHPVRRIEDAHARDFLFTPAAGDDDGWRVDPMTGRIS